MILSKLISYKECVAKDITIKHLTRKLERLEIRTQQLDARPSDYTNLSRVRTQLMDAQNYLCL
jgi:hypothetical protein